MAVETEMSRKGSAQAYAEADSPAEVERIVDAALSRIVRALTREKVHRSRLAEAGKSLSATDMWLLGYLAEHTSVRLTDLALWQSVDKSTITMQVKRLVAAGLVQRAVDERDRRAARVSLTPRGADVLEENREQARRYLCQLIGTWSPAERDALAQSVTRLADAVDASVGDAGTSTPPAG